jgi:glycosyltransferase involved in cell wall biosynthesis
MEQTNNVSRVIPNGVPSDALDFPLNKQSTEVRVLFVGRLLPGKGGIEAIKIFENALNLIPPNMCREKFVLEIIGIGPELDKLRHASTGLNLRIVFHGAKSHMETLSAMSESHILIFPSTYPEGLPTVILEAFANQMAVIVSSNMPGLSHAIESDVLLECESTDFTEKLLELLISPQSIERYGLKAREYVTANHDWSHLSSKFIEGIDN